MSGWEDALFGGKKILKHVETPGKFKGIAVGDLKKYNLKKSKKK